MKNYIRIIALVSALAFALVSCDRTADFHSESFATFESVNYSVSEAAGTISIPVKIYNPIDREVRLIVGVNNDTAVEDEDFSIVSPANKVLTFAPGEEVKNIEIELVHDMDMTGAKFFEVTISSADESFTVGQYNTAYCKIKDKEHPLDVFIGEWIADGVDYSTEQAISFEVSIMEDEYDTTFKRLKIKNLDPVSATMAKVFTLKATVDAAKTKITIASEQPVGYDEEYGSYFTFYGFSITSQGFGLIESVTLNYDQEKETLTIPNAYGTLFSYTDGKQYIGSVYAPGVVLRKK